MNKTYLKTLAAVSAVALGFALIAHKSEAGTIQSGGSFAVGATTTVNNLLNVTVTNALQFGTFGTVHGAANETVTATLNAANAFTGSTNGTAKLIDAGLADHNAATITVAAFRDTKIYASYGNVVNLTDTTTGLAVITVTSLADNLDGVTGSLTGVAGDIGGWTSGGGSDQGDAVTTAGGALVFKIGGVLTTVGTTTYPSDTYAGSFDLTLSY